MWKNGGSELDTGRFRPSLGLLLDAAMERAVTEQLRQITETDLLLVLFTQNANTAPLADLPEAERKAFLDAANLLTNYLAQDVRRKNCVAAFTAMSQTGNAAINPFLFESFRAPLGTWLDELADGAGIIDLILVLFSRADSLEEKSTLCAMFRSGDLLEAIQRQKDTAALFDQTGALVEAALKGRALYTIEQALSLASHAGEETVRPVHLMAAAFTLKESYGFLLLKRGGADVTSAKIAVYLKNAFQTEQQATRVLAKTKESFSADAAAILSAAQNRALAVGECRIGERELISELLGNGDAKLQYFITNVLKIDPAYYLHLSEGLVEPDVIEAALPLEICECKNLSVIKRELVAQDDVMESVVKVFFRKSIRNVLLHGDHGTGLTSMAYALAAALREGRYASLRQMQVIWFDLSGVTADDYEQAAEKLLRFFDEEPDRIYAVEGFAKYFKDHFSAVARRFLKNEYRLMILVDTAEWNELVAMGEQLDHCAESVLFPEAAKADVQRMIDLALPELEREYGVKFAKGISQVAYRMANDYLISKRFPKKAIELLAQTAADVAAEAEMRGKADPVMTREHLAGRMSVQTGLPPETILGTGADKDYTFLLSQRLVGQDAAVNKVAGRLDLIQKGMVDKKAPAAVFVFAGLSGTGKTELAKQIAQIYSSSRKLISFEMANFGESHSVSRLIGTPPGYVGYAEGGKLINDLNKDPYSVVLLDEIEKAHPAVWDPFLNLFDEGTITDMRGVTASGSKAFFVLTSNIGQYEIAKMLREGRPPEEIEEVVKAKFNTERHEKEHIPCFRPEFIGRIMRRGGIVVFNALSLEALEGIARYMFSKVAKEYGEVHEGKLICDDDVIEMLARRVYEGNEQAIKRGSGYYGGRELDILMNQYVDNKIASQLRQLAGVPLVRVVKNGEDTSIVPVYNDADAETLLAEKHSALVDRVAKRFDKVTMLSSDAFAGLSDDRLAKLNALLSEIDMIV
ncbi:MAG: AAA family ATPase [Eubacteriales bacterium]|nr:AAA family ATPase [Eubacteriales bacterium]